jgi:maltooligosyltrehalose trehalohydrolase
VRIVAPEEREIYAERNTRGYWFSQIEDVFPGTKYFFRLNHSVCRPDPASYFQPEGVHGPSQVVDLTHFWEDKCWAGVPLERMVIYEIHVGTFTNDGTFEAIIPRLEEMRELGITALEIMPAAQFPGRRNWGYDTAYPFAVQSSYGGPGSFKRFVEACHRLGLAVIVDVVYNHMGPEGNYLADFGPYFTDRYKIPWGRALNFDDAYSDEVRNFFFENALYWLRDNHVDALRLDAVHAIYDMSAKPFLQELAERVADLSRIERKFYLMAESDLNDVRIIKPLEKGGYGIDVQWCDDLHHALHVLLTGERHGYYRDFGRVEDLIKAFEEGFVYSWLFSNYRNRHHGSSSRHIPACNFVVFCQNHDQVGNRPLGERLSSLVSFEALKLAAGVVILSPYIPLIFMGEEYAEEAPFLYFVSHSEPKLLSAIREGRRSEIKSNDEHPDPGDPQTFCRSKISWHRRYEGKHRIMLEFYKRLFALRRDVPALAHLNKGNLKAMTKDELIVLERWHDTSCTLCFMNFNKRNIDFLFHSREKEWEKLIDSSDTSWMGPGSSMPNKIIHTKRSLIRPHSFVLYEEVRH